MWRDNRKNDQSNTQHDAYKGTEQGWAQQYSEQSGVEIWVVIEVFHVFIIERKHSVAVLNNFLKHFYDDLQVM